VSLSLLKLIGFFQAAINGGILFLTGQKIALSSYPLTLDNTYPDA
jgi:hypothetical protein